MQMNIALQPLAALIGGIFNSNDSSIVKLHHRYLPDYHRHLGIGTHVTSSASQN